MSALPKLIFANDLSRIATPEKSLNTKEKPHGNSANSAFFKMFTKLLSDKTESSNSAKKENEKVTQDCQNKAKRRVDKQGEQKSNSLARHLLKQAKAHHLDKASVSKNPIDNATRQALKRNDSVTTHKNARTANLHKHLTVDVAIEEYLEGLLQRLQTQSSQQLSKGALMAANALGTTAAMSKTSLAPKTSGATQMTKVQMTKSESAQSTAQQAAQSDKATTENKMVQQDTGHQEQANKPKSKIAMDTHFANAVKVFDRNVEPGTVRPSSSTITQSGSELGSTILKHMQAQGWIAKAAMHQGPLQFDINDKVLGKVSITLQQAGNITRVGLVAAPFSAAQLQVASDWLRKRLKGKNEVLVASRPQDVHNNSKEARSWR